MIAWFLSFNLINGLVFGLEHVTGNEDDEGMIWMIVLHLFIFRFVFGQMEVEDDEGPPEDGKTT